MTNQYFMKWQYGLLCEADEDNLPPGVEILGVQAVDGKAGLKAFLDAVAKAAAKAMDSDVRRIDVVFTTNFDGTEGHLNLASGEVDPDGAMRYTLEKSGLESLSLVPLHVLMQLSAQELKPGAKFSGPQAVMDSIDPKVGLRMQLDGAAYRPLKFRLVKTPPEDDGDDGDIWYLIIQVLIEEAVGEMVKPASDGMLAGNPNTAGGFAAEIQGLSKRTGRDVGRLKPAAMFEDDGVTVVFSMQPGKTGPNYAVIDLQPCYGAENGEKFGDPSYVEESWTAADLAAWAAKLPPKADLFLKSRKYGVFQIDDVDFKAGRPLVFVLGKWGELTEDGSPEDWAGFCDEAMADTAGNVDAAGYCRDRGLDESAVAREVRRLSRGAVSFRGGRLDEALVETRSLVGTRRDLAKAGLGFGYTLEETSRPGTYRGRLQIESLALFRAAFEK